MKARRSGRLPGCDRGERASVLSLTPVPRNLAQFSLTLLASAVAALGTSVALLVGAFVYGAAAWFGWLMESETPPSTPEVD